MDLIGLRQKKAHIMEIQINGGTISDKVVSSLHQYCYGNISHHRLTGLLITLRKLSVFPKYSSKMK